MLNPESDTSTVEYLTPTLYGRGRDIEEIESAVEFNETCRWHVLGETTEVRRTDERVEIIGILNEADEPMRPTDLAALTGSKSGAARKILHMMIAGEVRNVSRGRYVHLSRSNLMAADNNSKGCNIGNVGNNATNYTAASDGDSDA